MQRRTRVFWLAGLLYSFGLTGCDGAGSAPLVDFGHAQSVGQWQTVAQPTGGALPPQPSSAGATSVPPGSGVLMMLGTAGRPAAAAGGGASLAATGPAGSAAGPGGASGRNAGNGGGSAGAASGGAAGAASGGAAGLGSGGAAGLGNGGAAGGAGGSVTSLSFDVMTAPVGGLYQPRNIGAIWIQDSSARLVKSLEVWAGIRSLYLFTYGGARAGMPADVTASATLPNHRMHHASWNMKDRSGATVTPGKYTLYIELTDADWPGQVTSIDFDTSLGPQTISPPNATGFSAMKLQLQ